MFSERKREKTRGRYVTKEKESKRNESRDKEKKGGKESKRLGKS